LHSLPLADRQLLEGLGYKEKLQEVDAAILTNAKFLNQLVANPEIFGHDLASLDEGLEDAGDLDGQGEHFAAIVCIKSLENLTDKTCLVQNHSHPHSLPHAHDIRPDILGKRKQYQPTDFDMDKLRSTLKQLVRDWSQEVH
jgi:carnosine N-methyltransferase